MVMESDQGNEIKTYGYLSAGATIRLGLTGSFESIANPLIFPGQYKDVLSSFHNNYLRYYDPETGRYFTVDPIGLIGGINVYSYTSNNPVSFIDPLGLTEVWEPGMSFIPENPGQGTLVVTWSTVGLDTTFYLYDTKIGWLPQETSYSASNTLLGLSLHYIIDLPEISALYKEPDVTLECNEYDISISLGIFSKHTAVSAYLGSGRFSFNLGAGLAFPLGTPLTVTLPIPIDVSGDYEGPMM
jgi:RHS repeat-associated protein